jgi:hypothetical protein
MGAEQGRISLLINLAALKSFEVVGTKAHRIGRYGFDVQDFVGNAVVNVKDAMFRKIFWINHAISEGIA